MATYCSLNLIKHKDIVFDVVVAALGSWYILESVTPVFGISSTRCLYEKVRTKLLLYNAKLKKINFDWQVFEIEDKNTCCEVLNRNYECE